MSFSALPPGCTSGWVKIVGQSKRGSVIETITSTIIGYSVAVISQVTIFPLYGIDLTLDSNMVIAAWFTIISLVRGYWVRRIFNFLHVKEVLK
jgi:hypothetical protein